MFLFNGITIIIRHIILARFSIKSHMSAGYCEPMLLPHHPFLMLLLTIIRVIYHDANNWHLLQYPSLSFTSFHDWLNMTQSLNRIFNSFPRFSALTIAFSTFSHSLEHSVRQYHGYKTQLFQIYIIRLNVYFQITLVNKV